MQNYIRRFSKDVVGELSIYDFVVDKWHELETPIMFPWDFDVYRCEKCGHRKTNQQVFELVAIEVYRPLCDEEPTASRRFWMGVSKRGSLTYIPEDRVPEIQKQLPT